MTTPSGNPNCPPAASGPLAAVYVHVPFCAAKCAYCNFYSIPVKADLAGRYVEAALAELDRYRAGLSIPLASVFLGGGTPTVLPGEPLARLLNGLAGLVGQDTEFSVEANPATLGRDSLAVLRAGRVNRVSLGVQSFRDSELEILGRIHRSDQARRSVEALAAAGIDNIALDLIYGIPTQTLSSWSRSLEEALSLPIAHLSGYGLTFEPATPLFDDLQAGRVRPMEESTERDCYRLAIDQAEAAGLDHYEISNFARPGRQCRHNLTYWLNRPYLGIGPAAASYLGGVRRTNAPDLAAYLAAVENGQAPPATAERLTGREAMAEALMLALRLRAGVDRVEFVQRFSIDPLEAFGDPLNRYAGQGAIIVTDSHIRLAADALFVSDAIFADLIADA